MTLTTKVLLAFALVIAVALLAVGLLIGRGVRSAYTGYVAAAQQQQLAEAAAAAGALFAESGSWTAVQSWLDGQSSMPGMHGMMNQSGRGPMRGQMRWQERQGMGRMGMGALVVVDAESGASLVGGEPVDKSLLAAAAPVIVREQVVARIAPAALPGSFGPAEELLLSQVASAIRWSAVVAGAAALLLGALLAASILRPLRRLEAGVAQVASGNLAVRVPATGGDEIGRLAAGFNAMTEHLQQQEELRRRLVADIAHELRTPLSVLQGNLQAILDGVYPLTQEEIRTVYDETRLLSRLVGDLHELAQAEAGSLSLALQHVPVADALDAAAAGFRSLADAAGVALVVEPAPSGLYLVADVDRLQQVFNNLLGNALRHTPGGGSIRLSAGATADAVHIAVHNSGPAIPADELPHLFDRFYRADADRGGHPEYTAGAGLGLAIVKALVEAHGGRVGAESGSDAGVTFWFELPTGEPRANLA